MGNFIDLTGKTFGKLKVFERSENTKRGQAQWKCVCDCGNVCIVVGSSLQRRATTSCGCYRKEISKINLNRCKHGKRNSRVYNSWRGIKGRCYNPKNNEYKRYGGRGIKVCDEWLDKENGFINFYNYVSKLPHYGEPGYSINRIDNDGNYAPNNVEWSDDITQANNKRNNCKIHYSGEEHTMAEWERILGFPKDLIKNRIRRGWPVERALTEKPKKRKNRNYKKTS